MTSDQHHKKTDDSFSLDDQLRAEFAAVPERPIKRYGSPVVMVGGGVIDHDQLRPFAERYPLIAVDSGAVSIDEAGFKAELLIGDFDSVRPSARDDIPMHVKITDQYSTDFQKALAVVDAPAILGFGFLGKRMDHGLAVLHALMEHQDKTIILIDPYDIVVMALSSFAMRLPQGIRISIWSMTPQRFRSSKGLVWPLDNLEIGAGKTLGTSNQVVIPHNDLSRDIDVEITAEGDTPFAVMMSPEGLPSLLSALL